MSEPALDIPAISKKIETLRKSASVPYWDMVFADFMFARIADYKAVSRDAEAKETFVRLEKWVNGHLEHLQSLAAPRAPSFPIWKRDFVLSEAEGVRRTLAEKRALIPAAERANFSRDLSLAEKELENGDIQKAHTDLGAIRSGLIARLYRSYRARAAVIARGAANASHAESPATFKSAHEAMGLYNSQHTLDAACGLVGERDPIWVEDFLELYDTLEKLSQRLAPVEKKKK